MNTLAEKIAREIAETGPLPFARFMELALYCPVCGYYEVEKDSVGRRGDFYTSVSVGSLFGELLAFQFAEWLGQFKIQNEKLKIVEAGAHDGKLAADILRWLRNRRPELLARLEYWIVEPSARRQEWQQETLREFAPRIRWFADFQAVSQSRQPAANSRHLPPATRHPAGVCGIIFSNELLDAMPARRFGWDAQQREWFEWGVTAKDGRFVWARMPDGGKSEVARAFPQVPPVLLEVLPDGFTIETSPAAENWWREAAHVLRQGRLLTLDYGLTADELFQPERAAGTLRAYHRHRLSDDVLANVGEQDLTAHVNFTAIQAAGETAGLKTELFAPQAQFLTRIAERIWQDPAVFGEWTPSYTRQFQTLTHPEHLGRAFRVLVQARNSPDQGEARGQDTGGCNS